MHLWLLVDLTPYVLDVGLDDVPDHLVVVGPLVEVPQYEEKELLATLLVPEETHVYLKYDSQQPQVRSPVSTYVL